MSHWRWLRLATIAGMVLLWAVFLRTTWLGGPATYVIVRGDSMLPTYQNGDLLVLERNDIYAVGDAVAYRVPDGEVGAGLLVAHRIVGLADDGAFIMRGDNNPAPDPWTPTAVSVAGRVAVGLPAVGNVIAFLAQPLMAASLACGLTVMAAVARVTGTISPARFRVRGAPAAPTGN